MSEENKTTRKILRKVRVVAKILNLSLQEGEYSVTYQPISPTNYAENYKDKWAYYEPRLKEELEKAINLDARIKLFVHRIGVFDETGAMTTVFDDVVEARIDYS